MQVAHVRTSLFEFYNRTKLALRARYTHLALLLKPQFAYKDIMDNTTDVVPCIGLIMPSKGQAHFTCSNGKGRKNTKKSDILTDPTPVLVIPLLVSST